MPADYHYLYKMKGKNDVPIIDFFKWSSIAAVSSNPRPALGGSSLLGDLAADILPPAAMNRSPRMNQPHRLANAGHVICLAAIFIGALCASTPAQAFWLLGFSTADTLPPGGLGAIAGTGGQYSSVGDPAKNSFTPFLPHAGFRLGLLDNLDIGYRLTQTPLPFSGVGPTLGSEIDLKYRLTPPDSAWQTAIVVGGAFAYLQIAGQTKTALSPGIDLVVSHALTPETALIGELRYVYTEIPTGPGGGSANYVHALGGDLGARFAITKTVSLVPEVGLFDLTGQIAGRRSNGIGAQYGAVLAFRVW